MNRVKNTAGNPLSFPLCRRYWLVVIVEASMSALESERVRDRVLHLGFGALPGGQQEILGAWPDPDSQVTVWQTIANDLKVRGVERIRFVGGSDPASIQAAMRTSYPGVTVLPALAELLHQREGGLPATLEQLESRFAWPPRQSRILRNAVDAANQWSRHLNRAVARHGCFSCPAAVTSFVVDRLTRAERDLGDFGIDAFPGPARAVTRTIRRSSIAAPGV